MGLEPDRDRAIEALLRNQPPQAVGEPCLEAETLAAWVDGGLTDEEVALAEVHLAACSQCQAMLAVIAKGSPMAPSPEPWWRRSWGLGLLVPLTAGAAAIALWVASPAYQNPQKLSVAAQNEAVDARKPDASALADRFEVASSPTGSLRSPAATAPQQKRDATDGEKRALRQEEKTATTNAGGRDDLKERKLEAPAESLGAVVAPVASPSVPPPAAASPATAPLPAARPQAAPPPAAPAAKANADAAAPARSRAVSEQLSVATTDIVSPNPSIRWRIGRAGSVQYSTNGGASWEPTATGVSLDLSAGASPAPSVCWMVGRAGTIILTADGRRWQRVAFPETVDLTAVQAADARTATVRTADGRTFRTADGGATWTPVQDF